jgi:hypothetical protein
MTLPALLRSALVGMDRIQWTTSPEYAITHYWIIASLSSQPSSARWDPNSVVNNWSSGEITIINTIHPMKLALGSYRIIGIP